MKGIIWAGGKGTRLYSSTKVVSKQLLPIYDKPMIYYPLSVLLSLDIREILIVSTKQDINNYKYLLGNCKKLGITINYNTQKQSYGIAEAFIIGEKFIYEDDVCLILGDNIFYGDKLIEILNKAKAQNTGATIFGYPVNNPKEFGVVEFDDECKVVFLEEKPTNPKSIYAVPGLYFYKNNVINIAKKVQLSNRKELEITAVNNEYLKNYSLKAKILNKRVLWLDTGTPINMFKAISFVNNIQSKHGTYVGCIEEIAWKQGFISDKQFRKLGRDLEHTDYGKYILSLKEKKMSKFLITGGAGFIGTNYLHYVVNKYPNDFFVCIDALTYAGNYNNIKDLEMKDNYKFYKMDIRDRESILELFRVENFDYVINFAAESHVDNSIKNPNLFAETNIVGTMNLLNAVKYMKDNSNYPITRYHQISTDEVYGDLPLDRPDLKFKEDDKIKTSSPYSASKASADLEVLSYAQTYNLPITISRCSNNYGPYQYPEKLIPLMIKKAMNNEKLPVYGTGENIRDWIHVHDHNVGVDLIVRNGKNGEIYNLGGHAEKSNIEIVKIILRYLNKPESLIDFVKDRPGHDRRYATDTTKIENELGWTRKYNFDDGIIETIDWYVNHYDWLKNANSLE